MIRNICLKPGHFHIMLWDPESYSSLLFWSVFFGHSFDKGGWLLGCCQVEAVVDSSIWPLLTSFSLVWFHYCWESPDCPLGLLYTTSVRGGRCLITARWGWWHSIPMWSSNTAGGHNCLHYCCRGDKSQLPTCPSGHQSMLLEQLIIASIRVGVWPPSNPAGIDGGEAMDVLSKCLWK